ncbi:glycosyltransferase [Elizabethkingia sp. HX XZB]|uniref:glycosyltransferase n=1 Tax=Elizabethkingia sp. HX XZB TaxID=3003193 RepID=UPI002A23E952|nr:glycosyltransferase [Elizabethkingia sp. HX XZB]MDX8568404.1 glycosyltransferase [Elizabethkingia sp. HX XZB]
MISIVVSSYQEPLYQSFVNSVEKTIGVPYEIIKVENPGIMGICKAYNLGASKAKYDIICFSHEDVLCYSENWGEKVISHFNNIEVGMLGVTGCMVQTDIPSPWWYNSDFSTGAGRMLMKLENGKYYDHIRNPFNDTSKTEVKVIDGLWFCIRKSLFEKISFDELTFPGFHLYDMDISMQVNQISKCIVVYDILLEHVWQGKISNDYYEALLDYINKWQSKGLPVMTSYIKDDYFGAYNWFALLNVLGQMQRSSISKEIINKYKKYYYILQKRPYKGIYRMFFDLSKLIGYKNALRVFIKLEKWFKILPSNLGYVEYKEVDRNELLTQKIVSNVG